MGRLGDLKDSFAEDDEESEGNFGGMDIVRRRPNGQEYESARNVLAECLVSKAVPPSTMRRLKSGGACTILLIVPDSQSVMFETALHAMCSDTMRVIHCRPKRNDSEQLSGIKSIASGKPVIFIASDLMQVNSHVSKLVDGVYEVGELDAASLRTALRRCTRGRVPKDYAANLHGVPLDVVASAIVSGMGAKLAMATLEKLAVSAGEPAETNLPPLEDCIEFGELRDWGLALGRDLALWKAGKLPASSLDASILMVSPPGFGKTFFVRILQQHLGVPLVRLGIGEMMSGDGYLNTTLKNMTAAFASARRDAPSILFFDEVDTLARRSEGHRNDQYFNSVVNHALMDGAAHRNDGVVIIGATNRPEAIDPALRRPGRFARQILVPPPGEQAREHILRTHLNGDLADTSLKDVVDLLEGTSPAEIMQVVKESRSAARTDGSLLSHHHILKVLAPMGDFKPEVRQRIAVHEAGHAVCAVLLDDPGTSLILAKLGRASGRGGYTSFESTDPEIESSRNVDHRLMMLLSGRAAELAMLGNEKTVGSGGASTSDLALATRLVAASLGSLGLYDRLSWRCEPEHAMALVDRDPEFRRAVEEKLQAIMARAANLMQQHRRSLEAVAEHLYRHGSADASTIISLVWSAAVSPPNKFRPAPPATGDRN